MAAYGDAIMFGPLDRPPKDPKVPPTLGRKVVESLLVAAVMVVGRDLAKWAIEEIRIAAGRPPPKRGSGEKDPAMPVEKEEE